MSILELVDLLPTAQSLTLFQFHKKAHSTSKLEQALVQDTVILAQQPQQASIGIQMITVASKAISRAYF